MLGPGQEGVPILCPCTHIPLQQPTQHDSLHTPPDFRISVVAGWCSSCAWTRLLTFSEALRIGLVSTYNVDFIHLLVADNNWGRYLLYTKISLLFYCDSLTVLIVKMSVLPNIFVGQCGWAFMKCLQCMVCINCFKWYKVQHKLLKRKCKVWSL